ncbi:plastocyanin [Blastococcus colisei]|uniref:Plastocyanin n=1 Tax=Blastococcus colisei TaxID=1564162 RepID=A0A543P0Z4_9ACTN|nr:plastocyanin/azurin family copper-binding protein [Blastococcus colisei]TQN37794.1 plastocyanin [Blastococcus colisei]
MVAAALVLLAGCGGEESPGSGSAAAPSTAPGVGEVTTAPDGVQEITLQTQDDYVFLPDSFTVDPGTVRLTVVNVAEEMTHNLEFDDGEGPEPIDAGISLLAPGEQKTIEFTVTVPGDHPFTCTFHTQLGQVGTMTVRGR